VKDQSNIPDSFTAKGVEELQDALRAAEEAVTILEGIRDERTLERDKAKLELQRVRERSSVELAEAKVAEARLQRTNSELVKKVNRLEAEIGHLRTDVDWHTAARRELVEALNRLAKAYDIEADS
jgi:chromosome segregation ATPase